MDAALDLLLQRLTGFGSARMSLFRTLAEQQGIEPEDALVLPEPRHDGWYPLSSAQSRIFFIEALHGRSAALNVSSAARIDAGLDLGLLRQAVEAVAGRHEVFRLQFAVVKGEPAQRPGAVARTSWQVLHHEPGERVAIQDAIDREAGTAMDAIDGPLLRVLVVTVGAARCELVVTMHHIISDGWSIRLFLRELGRTYEALAAGRAVDRTAPPLQMLDLAAWEARLRRRPGWNAQVIALAGEYPNGLRRLALPGKFVADRFGLRPGRVVPFDAPGCAWGPLSDAGRAHGVTVFSWLLCAWVRVLDRYAWAADIPIAVPVTSRRRSELESVLGYLANIVLVAVHPASADRPVCRLAQVEQASRVALMAQNVAFEELIRRLPGASAGRGTGSMYDLMFEYLDFRASDFDLAGFEGDKPSIVTSRDSDFYVDTGRAKCALFLAVWQVDGHLAGAIEYETDVFDAEQVCALWNDYITSLREMAEWSPAAGP